MITHKLDDKEPMVTVTMAGDLSNDEAISWFAGFLTAFSGFTGLGGIVDTREVGAIGVSPEGVRQLAQMAQESDHVFAGSKWALVADKDVVYGIARMYEQVRHDAPYRISVFRSIEDAREWMRSED